MIRGSRQFWGSGDSSSIDFVSAPAQLVLEPHFFPTDPLHYIVTLDSGTEAKYVLVVDVKLLKKNFGKVAVWI